MLAHESADDSATCIVGTPIIAPICCTGSKNPVSAEAGTGPPAVVAVVGLDGRLLDAGVLDARAGALCCGCDRTVRIPRWPLRRRR
jgi:hypothetical protein